MKKKSIKISTASKFILAVTLSSSLAFFNSCSGGDGSPKIKDSVDKTIHEPTKGTVTEVEEIQPGNDYKIIDERLIDDKSKSIAIVHNLDNTVDTLSLQKIESDHKSGGRHSGLRGILLYSLAASYFRGGRMSGIKPDASKYKNANAYNKSTGLKNEMQSTSRTRTVKSPGKSSRGYGSGRSFRSHGG